MIKVLKHICDKYRGRQSLGKQDLSYIFKLILDECSIPYPHETFEYYLTTGIINELVLEVHNSESVSRDERFDFHNELSTLLKLLPVKRKGEEIKLRILGNQGEYPNEPIKRGKIRYEVFNYRPNLISVNKIESENQFRNDSWLYWISRAELKFATAIILTAPYRNFFPYFNPYDTVVLNYADVIDIPEDKLVLFLNQWLDIKNSFVEPNGGMFNREPRPDVSTYKYFKYSPVNSGFNKIFDSISIRDHLALRTCNYLVKGLMHKSNILFQEEALLSAFFALEGGLHMLQKKHGDSSTKLNRKLLREVFKNEIKYLPSGEGTFEFIEEGYFTRIALVHPEPDWGAEWNPYVHIGDFREYHGLARLVMSWALCEQPIDLSY